MKAITRALLAALLAGPLAVLPVTGAQAALPPAVEVPLPIPSGMTLEQKLKANVDFWTANDFDRMKKLVQHADVQQRNNPDGTADFLDRGRPWSGGGAVSKTAGKVLMHFGDSDDNLSLCSANAVISGNRSTVVTAGHCILVDAPFLGSTRGIDNWVFIPGFRGDEVGTPGATVADIAPYGIWAATKLIITETWSQNPNFLWGRDMGAAVVRNPYDSRRLTDVVGGQPIAFNQPQNQYLHLFGYPTDNERNWECGQPDTNGQCTGRQFTGRTLWVSEGTSFRGAVWVDDHLKAATAPGSSGGPLFEDFDETTGSGTQVAVTSRFHNPDDLSPLGWLKGPYVMATHFGDYEQAVYEAAQTTPVN